MLALGVRVSDQLFIEFLFDFLFLPPLLGFRVEVEMFLENEEDFPQARPITDLKKDFKLLGRCLS